MPCFVQMPNAHNDVRPRPVHVAVPSRSLYLALTARRWSRGFADAVAFFWRLRRPPLLQCLRINLLNFYFIFFQNRTNFQGGGVYRLAAFSFGLGRVTQVALRPQRRLTLWLIAP